ncbi:MAG: Nif3-like dinuclear metal center hexameric protein [Bacteroidales bacterium]|nr:Nif3-like dinuclear metal center hexameric protein [Bacteroidales bacterium]
MQHTIGDVVSFLDERFHPEYQEDYDNAGFLLGDRNVECRGVLVALDLTEAVADEAVEQGLNLIVTHHPFIFSGLKRITNGSETGRTVMNLIRNGIAVYAAHTNLDNLPDGVNGILAERLSMRNCRILKPFETDNNLGAGMVGELEAPMAADRFLAGVKELLGLPVLRCSAHEAARRVERVAICGGSGAFLIGDALAARADIYMTADLKYHDFQRTDGRMVLVDIGHYESEQFAKEIIYRAISEKFSTFACRISERQKGIVSYI